jgi:hypothetical protein
MVSSGSGELMEHAVRKKQQSTKGNIINLELFIYMPVSFHGTFHTN